MKINFWITLAFLAVLTTSCQKQEENSNVVSQKYTHTYGFDLSENEWKQRNQNGQITTVLENGVNVTNTYVDGVLHGTTTHTFPNSTIVQFQFEYDRGKLNKKILYDEQGFPIKEEIFEFDNRKIVTYWDKKAAPIKIEEYEDNILVKGKYFAPNNELEAHIDAGFGDRINRDRDGLLIAKEKFENGELIFRSLYHPNGKLESETAFVNYEPHGLQRIFADNGALLIEQNWEKGLLHGNKVVYRNQKKSAEIPYLLGNKHGLEKRYDESCNLASETHWEHNQRHGTSRYYKSDDTLIEWYYKDMLVSLKQFQMFELRDKMVAELREEKLKSNLTDEQMSEISIQ